MIARVERNFATGGVSLWLYEPGGPGAVMMLKPVELSFESKPYDGGAIPEPTIQFRGAGGETTLRSILDAAISAGIMPTAYERNEDLVKALAAHLGDSNKVRDRLLTIVEKGGAK